MTNPIQRENDSFLRVLLGKSYCHRPITEIRTHMHTIQQKGIQNGLKSFFFNLKKFLLKYSCYTMLYKLQVYNTMIHNFRLYCSYGYYKILAIFPVLYNIFLLKDFFLYEPFLKSSLNFLQYCCCFVFWFFGCKVYGM